MESFDLVFSTHIHFGPDVVDQIGATARTLGERVLVLHGSFALSSGLFERIAGHLEAAGCDVITGSPVTATGWRADGGAVAFGTANGSAGIVTF